MTANTYLIIRLLFLGVSTLSLLILLLLWRKGRTIKSGTVRWGGTILLLVLICGSLAGFFLARTMFGAVFDKAGKVAAPFGFRVVADDVPKTLADYRDKVVLVNYWATW